MSKLHIKLLAVAGSPKKLINDARTRIETLLGKDHILFTETEPDILWFLTGGTERAALDCIHTGRFYVLIGSRRENAYASATEVKALLNEKQINSLLLDEDEAETPAELQRILKVKQALARLQGQKLGLIGEVSDWLIASKVSEETLQEKLGIHLKQIAWESQAHYSEFQPDAALLETFGPYSQLKLEETAKVSSMLSHIVRNENLDAMTVECFPMVKKDKVTACLPLAQFNNRGFPAGCEGDLTAIAGMMLCRELTGIVPWIANLNKVSESACMFSHCTVAPSMINNMQVKTHFETGVGTAVQGQFKATHITVFRFDRHLQKAFISEGKITARPEAPTACRTQIEAKISKKSVKLLQDRPLGNHHLIIPGGYTALLKTVCHFLGIEVLG